MENTLVKLRATMPISARNEKFKNMFSLFFKNKNSKIARLLKFN